MADIEPIVIYDWRGGIGNDKYFPIKNWCYDGQWLDVRQGRRIILSTHNANNVITIPNNSNITSIWDILTGHNWYIYDLEWVSQYLISNTANYRNIRNYVRQFISGTEYFLLFSPKFIHRYPVSGLVNYTRLEDWGSDANRNIVQIWDNVTIEHTAWSTGAFVWNIDAVAWKQYNLRFTSQVTAWSYTITIWWATAQSVTASGTYSLFFTASNTTSVTITPTTTFVWNVFNLDIGASTMEEWRAEMDNISYVCPVLKDTGDVYVGNGNKLYDIDPTGVLSLLLTFWADEEIVGITKVQEQIFIRVRNTKDTIVYVWDWVTETPTSSITWFNEIIQQVQNMWTYHIVITWWDTANKKIRWSDWFWKTLLYTTTPATNRESDSTSNLLLPPIPLYFWDDKNINSTNIDSYWDLVFLPSYNGVMTYWHTTPWFPDGLFLDYPLVNCSEIYSIHYDSESIKVSYNDDVDDDCKVATFYINNYEQTQDSTTNYYFGDKWYITFSPIVSYFSQDNVATKVKLGYKSPTNTFLNLYYKVNGETDRFTFVVDETVNPVTTDPIVWSIYKVDSTSRYTVTKVTKFLNYMFIETQCTVKSLTPRRSKNLVKVTGTGDTTITTVWFHDFRHFDCITSTTELNDRQWIRNFPTNYFEMQLRVEEITRDWKYTPEFNDLQLLYEPKPNG